jgi:glyoxylase-like metal-dependent hydrolase (beta-lactamase superfamily II)
MKAVVIPVTPFAQNCTLMWCEDTGMAAVVDPGGDLERILEQVDEQDVTLERILVTHGHIDHAGGVAELGERFGLPIEGPHPNDRFLVEDLAAQGARFGFSGARSFEPERWLADGDTVRVGDMELEVRHCPGHTPGHIIFFHAPSQIALVGDVLFNGSVGRSDLPRGDHTALINSIRSRLWPLGDDVTFVPGHGPTSTFGHERKTNPFCADFVQV